MFQHPSSVYVHDLNKGDFDPFDDKVKVVTKVLMMTLFMMATSIRFSFKVSTIVIKILLMSMEKSNPNMPQQISS